MKLFPFALISASLILAAAAVAGESKAPGVGDQAPEFTVMDQDGKEWSLKKKLSDRPLVVYFYPAAMTGGCTTQACAYRDYVKAGEGPKFDVVGISGDAVENLKHFRTAENLNFPLLSDPDGKVAKAFGVPTTEGEKSIVRTVEGKEVTLTRTATTKRWTFIISPAGEVVYKSEQVKPIEDLAAVTAFISKSGN